MSEFSDRTEQEREAARLERERRRAERAGGTTPRPAAPSRAAVGRPQRGASSSSSSSPPSPLSRIETVPPKEPDEPLEDELGLDEDLESEDHEAPAGTRRVSRLDGPHRSRPPARPRPQRPQRPRRPQRSPSVRPRKRHSWRGRLVSLVALVLAAAAIWFLYELFQPFNGSGHGSVEVTIPAHSSAGQIGDLLERDGVISSGFFFKLRATLAGDRGDLRSGTYRMQLGMSYGAVLKILTTPPKPAKVSNLTLIEGLSRYRINALLRSQHIRGNYLAQTRRSSLLNPRAYGAPRGTPSLEGFLFPSTYQLRDPITVGAIVNDQLKTFKTQFATVNLSYARSKRLTPYDVLIIASMVQAEAQTARDRPLIASVIYNRLRLGMPLQIDATTRYATGNYTSPLTVSQLNSPSPYNTRIHRGLPPTPIDNPGLASIQAAAHPARTSYLYFVVKPCGNGEHVFASSYSQFLHDAALYQSARSARGGSSPASCG